MASEGQFVVSPDIGLTVHNGLIGGTNEPIQTYPQNSQELSIVD